MLRQSPDLLVAEDFVTAGAEWDDVVKGGLPEEDLRRIWQSTVDEAGCYAWRTALIFSLATPRGPDSV